MTWPWHSSTGTVATFWKWNRINTIVLIYTTTTERLALWCWRPLSIIFQLYGGGNRSIRRKPSPAASHWQTLSHNVISSTPRLIGIRTQTTAGYSRINRSISSWFFFSFDSNCIIYCSCGDIYFACMHPPHKSHYASLDVHEIGYASIISF
jgi:hypothetical protein